MPLPPVIWFPAGANPAVTNPRGADIVAKHFDTSTVMLRCEIWLKLSLVWEKSANTVPYPFDYRGRGFEPSSSPAISLQGVTGRGAVSGSPRVLVAVVKPDTGGLSHRTLRG